MIGKITWPIRMAIAELRNEWLFSFGVALAVCSVLTPIMLLWGAKTGVVDSLRTRLLKDPRTRELISIENEAIPASWFESMRHEPGVEFIVPCVRMISLYGHASSKGSPGNRVEVSLLPTAPGDPLGELPASADAPILNNPVHCTVSSMLAEDLSLTKGSQIVIEQSRVENEINVTASFRAVVHKVLSSAESHSRAVYLPLFVTEMIEDYKDGREVNVFGWKNGGAPRLERYDAVRIYPEDSSNWPKFLNASDSIARQLRLDAPVKIQTGGRDCLEFRSETNSVSADDLDGLLRDVVPFDPIINLHIEPVNARMQGGASPGQEFALTSSDDEWHDINSLVKQRSHTTTPSHSDNVAEFSVISQKGGQSRLVLEWPEGKAFKGGVIKVDSRTAGAVGAAHRTSIEYSGRCNYLRPLRTEYLGFRLYARRLEDVKSLRILCAKSNIATSTQEDRISQVISLDQGLGRLFMFIAIAGLLGGVGTLMASLYLSIERSKRQFAVLQIIGIPTVCVLFSTMLQGLFVVMAGAATSFVLCLCGASLLQKALGKGLQSGDKVCSLGWSHWSLAIEVVAACAILASIIAARRLRIEDPAVIARSE